MYENKTIEKIYKIIKYRKRKHNINYLDNERIFGYDYITYSKAFIEIINTLYNSQKDNIKIKEYIKKIKDNDDIDYENPLKGIDRSTINYLSNIYNIIDDYIKEKEINIINQLEKYNKNDFENLDIKTLGFDDNVNLLLINNNIYTLKDLEEKENNLLINNNIKKIVYTKYYAIKRIIFNKENNNIKYTPISKITDNDFKTYNKLRLYNIYTLDDLQSLSLEDIIKITNLKKEKLYLLIKKIHNNNIHLNNEEYDKKKIKSIEKIYIPNLIPPLYYDIKKYMHINNINTLKDMYRLNLININKIDYYLLTNFSDYYIKDLILNAIFNIQIKDRKTKTLIKQNV